VIVDWNMVAALAAATAVLGSGAHVAITKIWPWLRARYSSQSLSNRIGGGEYTPFLLANALFPYVEPLCSQVDPSGREDFRALVPMAKPLFGVLDEFLQEGLGARYLILLADSGMGKTSALINYYARNLRRRRPREIVLLYLGAPHLLDRIDESQPSYEKILFLDALDEDTAAIADHRERVLEVMQTARQFRGVVISCRTQFFLKDEEITRETGIVRYGPRRAGVSGTYEFQKLYLRMSRG
jgi:hypothetical protein